MRTKINDGGPAFPLADPMVLEPRNVTEMKRLASGMSMRDHFAGLAPQGICAHEDTWGLLTPDIAKQAYVLADEMIKARVA
jgi:hypothetical protein